MPRLRRARHEVGSSRVAAGLAAAALASGLALPAQAYRAEQHQELTYVAAKQFNRCVEDRGVPRLSALEVRYLVRGNLREGDAGFFGGLTRWPYYDRSGRGGRRLMWLVETRIHERFTSVAESLSGVGVERPAAAQRYEELGALIHYIQQVTVPAHVVPIMHVRPWRWYSGDRFNGWPIDERALEEAIADVCSQVNGTPADATWRTVLDSAAAATMSAIRSPIDDLPATWQVFWEEDDPGRFGSYGRAGNSFGRPVSFRCGEERCHLLENDPLYREFALRQHRLAVVTSMRALLLMQRRERTSTVAGEGRAGGRR